MRLIFLILVSALITGCATKEGIRLPGGSGPTKESAEDFNKRNSTVAAGTSTSVALPPSTVKTTLIPDSGEPRMIVIGNVMALTVFDEATLGKRYDAYLKAIEAKSGTSGFTREWYVATSAGETAVKFSGITGLYTRFFKAEIPKDVIRQISFASAFGTFMAGTSGDLVAAERTAKTGTWVTRLLCSEKMADYDKCEAQYSKGLYQSSDGREIDDKLQLVTSGKVINPHSYRLASLDPPAKPVVNPALEAAAVATPPSVPPVTAAVPAPAIAGTVPASQSSSSQTKDVTKQLEKLNELRSKGLITEAEYQKKRQEVIDSF